MLFLSNFSLYFRALLSICSLVILVDSVPLLFANLSNRERIMKCHFIVKILSLYLGPLNKISHIFEDSKYLSNLNNMIKPILC